MFDRLKPFLKKKWVIVGVVLILVGGGFWYFRGQGQQSKPLYVLSAVTQGTLITSITGSGQVSGQSQVDIKPQVSGAVTKVLVQPNDSVKAGQELFDIDQTIALQAERDAIQAVSNARISLQASQLSLDKLKEPPDTVSLTQAQNTLNQAQRALEKLQQGADPNDIAQSQADLSSQLANVQISSDGKTPVMIRNVYDSAVPSLRTMAQSLQQSLYDADAILGIDDTGANVLYVQQLSALDPSRLISAKQKYIGAKESVLALKQETDALQASGEDPATIDATLADAQKSIDLMAPLLQSVYEALLNTVTTIGFTQSNLNSLEATIQGDRSDVASKASSLVSQIQSVADIKTSYANALLSVEKAQASLDKLKAPPDPKDLATAQDMVTAAQRSLDKLVKGADPIDIALTQNSIQQRQADLVAAQNKLADQEATLAEYSVKAPFDGVIAKITVEVGGQASGGTAMATIVTQAKTAQLSLNEVDATKVHVGQKATLTFEAIPDFSVAGSVYQIDPLGTVSQGVVNYAVEISFASQDDRIKPGMSVTASIITDIETDVLLVPNAAIHSSAGGQTTVQVLNVKTDAATMASGVASDTPPESRPIQIGTANDENTVVTSGVVEGDQVVTRTIQPTTARPATTSAAASSALRIPGLGGGATGGFGGAGGAARGGTATGRPAGN